MKPYSIVIPTCDNVHPKCGTLVDTLGNLKWAKRAIEEIIIVEDGERVCASLLNDFMSPIPLRLEHSPKWGNRAAARNVGARVAQAPFLVFLDDDMLVPDEAFLEAEADDQLVAWAFAEKRYIPLTVPREKWRNALKERSWSWLEQQSTTIPGQNKLTKGTDALYRFTSISCFGIVKKEVFWRTGGYDEEFVGWGPEDTEYLSRLMLDEPVFNLFPEIVTFHIDHYVTPYKRSEGRENERRFEAALLKRNQQFNIYRLAENIIAGKAILRKDSA